MRILSEKSSEVKRIGDIRENSVGIDIENVDFITNLLTSNLYSNPLESFLRETVSNAYDAHVEAGTDQRILMVMQGNENTNDITISIRDYGVGISPERFNKIYRNVGSSTKRETDDYIGGLGIGRFAGLSLSDNVLINSFYNGTKYSYLMYKNGTGISIDEIQRVEGDFKQGVEVIVSISTMKYNTSSIEYSINKLAFFDNLYIKGINVDGALNRIITIFNNRKCTNYGAFSTSNLDVSSGYKYYLNENYIRLGNVIYPLDRKYYNTKYSGVYFNCPIGSVQVTPNREALQYTEKTQKKINEIVSETNKAIVTQCWNTKHSFTDYKDFIQSLTVRLLDNVSISLEEALLMYDEHHLEYTICGKVVPEGFCLIFKAVSQQYIPVDWFRSIYNTNKRLGSRIGTKFYVRTALSNSISLGITKESRIRKITKDYWNEKSPMLIVDNVRKCLKSYYAYFSFINKENLKKSLSFILKTIPTYVISNDAVPKEFIESRKKVPALKIKEGFEVRNYSCLSYSSNSEKYLDYVKKNCKWIIYGESKKNDSVYRDLGNDLHSSEVAIITVPSKVINEIHWGKKFIHIDDFLTKKQKYLCKVFTAKYIEEKWAQFFTFNSDMRCQFFKYRRKYQYNDSPTMRVLREQYRNNNWWDWAALIKFRVTKKMKQIISSYRALDDHKSSLVQYLILSKYSKDRKLLSKYGININNEDLKTIKSLLQ